MVFEQIIQAFCLWGCEQGFREGFEASSEQGSRARVQKTGEIQSGRLRKSAQFMFPNSSIVNDEFCVGGSFYRLCAWAGF